MPAESFHYAHPNAQGIGQSSHGTIGNYNDHGNDSEPKNAHEQRPGQGHDDSGNAAREALALLAASLNVNTIKAFSGSDQAKQEQDTARQFADEARTDPAYVANVLRDMKQLDPKIGSAVLHDLEIIDPSVGKAVESEMQKQGEAMP